MGPVLWNLLGEGKGGGRMTPSMSLVWHSFLLLPVNYYVSTLCLWWGHWFAHQAWSPLRNHHVLSHHRLYPDSDHCLSERFHFARGRHDSNKALLPWFAVPIGIMGATLPVLLRWVSLVELLLCTGTVAWLHAQFHVATSPLARWSWFRRARARHWIHHDDGSNHAVGDHLWDRLFGTFRECERGSC